MIFNEPITFGHLIGFFAGVGVYVIIKFIITDFLRDWWEFSKIRCFIHNIRSNLRRQKNE